MSLFKARDWWSATVGDGAEEFDLGCLSPIYTSTQAALPEMFAIGSHAGVLRLFRPGADKSGLQPEQLLLEQNLGMPILQIACGLFVPAINKPGLAVLHPRRLSVYTISATSGAVEHGNQYKLQTAYHHNLSRTSFNMCHGPFGQIQGKEFLCVQSMDGTLSVYEQESFSFTRFLPDSLLPGPLVYLACIDSFITVSSNRQVESFKYQVLAVAMETKTKEEAQNIKSGKRVVADWSLVIGEDAISVAVDETSPVSILVLGERNIYCVNEFGQLRFMKRLEYTPRCMKLLPRDTEALTYMVASHTNTLMIYKNTTLSWAAQINFTPVLLDCYPIRESPGGILVCDENGHVTLSYLGTDPAMMVMPSTQSRETQYDDYAKQIKQYQHIIKQHSNKAVMPSKKLDDEVILVTHVPSSLDSHSEADGVIFNDEDEVPSITVRIEVKAKMLMSNVKVTLNLNQPLATKTTEWEFASIGAGSPAIVSAPIFMKYNYLPAELRVECSATYTSSTGAPRVAQTHFNLPLKLVVKPAVPVKSSLFKVTIDTNKPPVKLNDLFPELLGMNANGEGNAIGFQFYGGPLVTMLASKTSQRYRLQSDDFCSMWLLTRELTERLTQNYGKHSGLAFSHSGSLPLQEYFESIDAHFEYRVHALRFREILEQKAAQFRAIQRRLLTRFKDKTPAPLAYLDTLLEGTYRQMLALADHADDNKKTLYRAAMNLSSSTQLITYLTKITYNLSDEEFSILQSVLSPHFTDTSEQGWEETVDTALTHQLRTSMSKSAKDQNVNIDMVTMGTDTGKLKKHIAIFLERLSKGAKLSSGDNFNDDFSNSKQSKASDKILDQRNIAEPGREDSTLGASDLPLSSQLIQSPRGGSKGSLSALSPIRGRGGEEQLPPLNLGPIKQKKSPRREQVPDLDELTNGTPSDEIY